MPSRLWRDRTPAIRRCTQTSRSRPFQKDPSFVSAGMVLSNKGMLGCRPTGNQHDCIGVLMKKRLIVATVLIGLSIWSCVLATEEEKSSYTCPLCDNRFEAPPPPKTTFEEQLANAKSTDSDFCSHSADDSPLFRMVVTCANCLYSAYAKEFSQPLRESHKPQLKSMLEKNPLPPSVKKDEIPPWLKWQYAARCYKLTRTDALFVGQAFHGASYCARIQATASATAKLPLKDPESVLPQLEGLEKKISAETDKPKKVELMLLSAQAAHRGGFVELRDKWTAQLEKEARDNAALQEQLRRFKELASAEKQCLEEALECYETAMNEEQVPYRNRTLYNYLIGDILRRLGGRRSSVVGYYAHVTEDDDARPDLKRLANYFIEYMSR